MGPHYSTPVKAHLLGVSTYLDSRGIHHFKSDLFRQFGISKPRVKEWKQAHGLKHYFNVAGSPDLSPIENCWRAVKQYIRANYRIGADMITLVKEGWSRITQTKINELVDSMVRRMQDVVAAEGRMTGW